MPKTVNEMLMEFNGKTYKEICRQMKEKYEISITSTAIRHRIVRHGDTELKGFKVNLEQGNKPEDGWVLLNKDNYGTVTRSYLTDAIERSDIDYKKFGYSSPDEMAIEVMDRFGFSDSIVDNDITPKERKMFYMFQSKGILKTHAIETLRPISNKWWKIHYWIFNKENIFDIVQDVEKVEEIDYEDMYEELPNDIWEKVDI